MTTLIQQRTDNDCVLASMAMALGFARWEDAWTEDDLKAVVESRGISDIEPWLKRHGLEDRVHYRQIHCWNDERLVTQFLWKRRALVSINSLNHDGGGHMVYWDGDRVWDPNDGLAGKIALPFISAARMTRVAIFHEPAADLLLRLPVVEQGGSGG